MAGMSGILFYSNNCKYSSNLLKVMMDQDILRFFTQKCIDNMDTNELIQMGLKVVPTLVVVNKSASGNNKQIYEEAKAFEWVQQLLTNRRESMIKMADQRRRLIQINNIKSKHHDGLHDHDPLETGGVSDDFAYWAQDMTKDIDIAQPKSFLPFGKDDQYSIATFMNSKEKEYKINEADQKRRLAEIEQTRKMQNNSIQEMNEKQHMDAVMKSDYGL